MPFRFFSLPGHRLTAADKPLPMEEALEPRLPALSDAVEHALAGAEFRDFRARDRLRSLLHADRTETSHGAPAGDFGPSAVFARPPNDLPALLRLADQLEMLARQEEGERALVWKCAECGTRYAVPVALVRQVSIRCERCTRSVELSLSRCLGEESLLDPFRGSVNEARKQLAGFFREAMARGWPVLVSSGR